MSNGITLEEQRFLTEFLGECWHEFEEAALHDNWGSSRGLKCKHCHLEALQPQDKYRLDFTDGRVVFRLIEKVRSKVLEDHGDFFELAIHDQGYVEGIEKSLWSNDPELAVCKTIAAFLMKEEKDKSVAKRGYSHWV